MRSWLLLTAVFVNVLASAADLEIRFTALEKMVSEQMFTEEGKRWVKGNATSKCQFAYLEMPHVGAEQDRIKLTARFSGRSAVGMFGKCVGMGDSFDLSLTAVPVVQSGGIALREVRVNSVKDSYYIRRVRAALAQGFQKDFKIEVKDQARKMLEQPGRFEQKLAAFELQAVHVIEDSLVLVVDFKLVVK